MPYWGGTVHYALLGWGDALYLIGVEWCTVPYWGGMVHYTLLGWDAARYLIGMGRCSLVCLASVSQVEDSLYSPWPGLSAFVGISGTCCAGGCQC